MMRLLLLACVLLASCSRKMPARDSSGLETATCLGPADARHAAVYLHGFDGQTPSAEELAHRRVLQRIAGERSIRIALPRGARDCGGKRCWGEKLDYPDVLNAFSLIDGAARECFGEREFGMIGFSNGGYLLTKMLSTCVRQPRAKWMISVGAGMLKGPLGPLEGDLAECGQLVMIVGKGDTHNYDPGENLLKQLQANRAVVRAVRFDGGHLMPREVLDTALDELTRPPQ